jgi:hypothetical protein
VETRTKRTTVTFAHPFRLKGVDGVHPAGPYEVDTDEELIDGLSFLSWRRVATMIYLDSGDGATEVHRLDPGELDAALRRDAEAAALSGA